MTRDDIVKQALHKLAGHDDRTLASRHFKSYDLATESWSVNFVCSCGAVSQPIKAVAEYIATHPLAFYELPLRW